MIQKFTLFFLCLVLSSALNGQSIDTLKNNEISQKGETKERWARLSFGLNGGCLWRKSRSIGLLIGDYRTSPTPMLGLTLKLNLGKKLSVGTAFNWYELGFSSISPITVTTEAPSTIPTEPNYLLNFEGSIRAFYVVFDVPFEITYKFNPIKKHYIPILSIGTTYLVYNSNYRQFFAPQLMPYTMRTSGSRPVEEQILNPNSNLVFTNPNHTSPFVTTGISWALSEHSSVKLQAKYAFNQNTAVSFLSSKSETITRSTTFQTQQMGLIAEYFITF